MYNFKILAIMIAERLVLRLIVLLSLGPARHIQGNDRVTPPVVRRWAFCFPACSPSSEAR
jgi:hypothetical protein